MYWIETPHTDLLFNLPDLHPLVGEALIKLGITSPKDIQAFIDPNLYQPTPGTEIPGMPSAADRLEAAIRKNESICIWGDFDADGQTATTVLVQTLQALGADVTYHIPIRAYESHGVNIPNLKKVIDHGAQLVVTCDTGITAHEAVDYARSRSVDFVITDHHDLPDFLPNATAVTDPKLLPDGHPLGTLAGVGVAYKLAEELLVRFKSDLQPDELLDLVALGLVADLALLKQDTRFLVQKGLEKLRNTRRQGLTTMMEIAELNPSHLTEEHIGFVLGPRLNALGRLGDANPAVELLTTSDPIRARVLATQLEGLNIQRKLLCEQVCQAAEAQLRDNPSLLAQPVIVLAHSSWPGGVVGIAASRIVDRYGKPAILLTTPPNEPARGSARSIDGLNITAAIAAQRDILLSYGGHPMAAGLSLDTDKLPEFRRRLSKTVESMLGKSMIEEATLGIDGWVDLNDVNLELSEQLEKLAPFGPGNEKLILAVHGITIKDRIEIGTNKEHLKLTVEDDRGYHQEVLWWDGGNEELPDGRIDLAFTLRASDWQGVRRAQLEWVDFRLQDEKPLEIKRNRPEVIDYRSIENPLALLKTLPEETVLWAEGPDNKQGSGVDRMKVKETESLAIWTTPPSPEVLREVLESARPKKVYLFAVDPNLDEPNVFLERLTGLVKYAINHKDGQTSISELAAACAQGEKVIRRGVDWLVKRGHVSVESISESLIQITLCKDCEPDQESERIFSEIQSLLKETSAYRAHFIKADKESLLP